MRHPACGRARRLAVRPWRSASPRVDTFAVIATVMPILDRANLEHPLGYLYFLGLLGLLLGQVLGEPVATLDATPPRASAELLRYASLSSAIGRAARGRRPAVTVP